MTTADTSPGREFSTVTIPDPAPFPVFAFADAAGWRVEGLKLIHDRLAADDRYRRLLAGGDVPAGDLCLMARSAFRLAPAVTDLGALEVLLSFRDFCRRVYCEAQGEEDVPEVRLVQGRGNA